MPVRIIVDPAQYTNIIWPEYWLTHANIDKLWAAGVPIRQRIHDGVTHMKTLVTSTLRHQRLVELRAELAARPRLLRAGGDQAGDLSGDRRPRQRDVERHGRIRTAAAHAAERRGLWPPRRPNATGVATNTTFVWNRAAWAVSYDVYLGTSQANMTLVGNVPAQLVTEPADDLLVDAAGAAAGRHDLLLESGVAHQRDAAGAER